MGCGRVRSEVFWAADAFVHEWLLKGGVLRNSASFVLCVLFETENYSVWIRSGGDYV